MSKLISTLFISFILFTAVGAGNDIEPEKVEIFSASEFEEQYGSSLRWQHVVRLKRDNPNFDFTNVNIPSDFSSLTLTKNTISAYKLYDGRIVVFNGHAQQGSTLTD